MVNRGVVGPAVAPYPDGGEDDDGESAQDEDVSPEWQHSSNAPIKSRDCNEGRGAAFKQVR